MFHVKQSSIADWIALMYWIVSSSAARAGAIRLTHSVSTWNISPRSVSACFRWNPFCILFISSEWGWSFYLTDRFRSTMWSSRSMTYPCVWSNQCLEFVFQLGISDVSRETSDVRNLGYWSLRIIDSKPRGNTVGYLGLPDRYWWTCFAG